MKRITKYLFVALILVLSFGLDAQMKYPAAVEAVLQKTKNNRGELEKALNYFYKRGDSLKIKAINFLISNMDIHSSYNYYWADSIGRRLSYNELDYPDFDSSIRAFDALKQVTPKIHPVSNIYRDMDSINGDYLIKNMEMAFADWQQPYAKNISFDDFCEYLLPYRISVEPVQDWREYYKQYFRYISDSTRGSTIGETISAMTSDCHKWFTNTFREQRTDPLPRLGALQLIHRKKGACEDLAGLGVMEARALGIAVTEDFVPYWATTSGSHFFDVAISCPKNIPFDELSTNPVSEFRISREPGKVLRLTYSKQSNTLANLLTKENLPTGFMRSVNYKDVTSQYWETKEVDCKLFNVPQSGIADGNKKVMYACVFNYLDWRPIWWGIVKKDSAKFSEMGKGAVYLPIYYQKEKLIPAGYPVAVGYQHELVLKPDTTHTHSIHLKEQDKYLKYRSGKNYKLYYWDNRWKLKGSQNAVDSTTELVFDKIPKNALLLMIPEYTQYKERPFMITEEGERIWW